MPAGLVGDVPPGMVSEFVMVLEPPTTVVEFGMVSCMLFVGFSSANGAELSCILLAKVTLR